MSEFENDLLIGFNSKHYNYFILKAICLGYPPEKVKEVNDFIIAGNNGWEYEDFKDQNFNFNNVDIMDDMQVGLSLKSIEGHLGMNIEESSVPFDIDRALTKEEIDEVIAYCKHDVFATKELIDFRKDYLKSKQVVGELAELPIEKAFAMTNAKLTAAMLKAEPKEYNDEREYVYPDKLNKDYIPQKVFDFFDRMKDKSIPDDVLFSEKLELILDECIVTLGYGGIHGAIPHFEETNKDNLKLNFDVGSYYPHLMILYGYTSRSIPSPQVFEDIVKRRMKAKKEGDTATAAALKLVINTTYGAMLNKYNALYDPLMGRSVCISGQLFLLELAVHLYTEVPGLKIIQLNTDGIMISCPKRQKKKVEAITTEWQERTGFTLEEDSILKIIQKDVNNYIEIQENGDIKTKGAYLVRGVSSAGAFNINNTGRIVAKAIKNYFAYGTSPDETINECDDPYAFQIIAKASSKYTGVYHLVDDRKIPVQKCNRVFASVNSKLGALYKINANTGKGELIASLPEHCMIYNESVLPFKGEALKIDKQWYIDLAKKRINDFLGVENPERRKMAATKKADDTTSMNVYQKLITARYRFLEENVKRTGKNMKLTYKYFQLDDIVPVATKIFQELHLLTQCEFTGIVARMTIIDTDYPEDTVEFAIPMREPEPIVNAAGASVVNSVQLLGSSITYLRRYLYLIALDIAEADDFDSNTEVEPPKTSVKPPSAVERKETAKEITNADGKATDLQVTQLKKALKALKDKNPDTEPEIARIAIETESFKHLTKTKCEELIKWASEQVKEAE